MNLEDLVGNYRVYIVMGAIISFFLLFLLVLIQAIRISKLKKKYISFLRGNDGKSLEEIILTRLNEVDQLKDEVASAKLKIHEISEVLLTTYQKMGIVKYDAFKEMGGKLSFALALLDDSNNGFIINSMHSSREGCYTYIKEILHGESFVVLSEEEKAALNTAINRKNYME